MINLCTWVVDPDGEARNAARHTSDVASGRICARPRPSEEPTIHAEAVDVLLALDKDLNLPDSFRNVQHRWLNARCWLIGDAISDLHVIDADTLPTAHRERYMTLAVETGIRLWLIARSEPIERATRRQLRNWVARTATASEFVGQLPRRSSPAQRDDMPTNLTLPEDDFYVFRAVCRREFDDRVFAELDEWWKHGFRCALSWELPAADVPSAVGAHVRTLLNTPMVRGEALVTTRGVQAGLFLRGVLMRVALGRFLHEMTTQSAGAPTDEGIRQLRRFANPAFAAAALIVWLTDAGPSELQTIKLTDVAEDGSSIIFSGHSVDVPEGAHGTLRSLLAARELGPPGVDDELFAIPSQTNAVAVRPSTHALRRWLAIVSDGTGLPFLRRDTIVKNHDRGHWLARRGMSVVTL